MAARLAGYSENSAKEIATENLTKPHISAYVEFLRKELYTNNRATIDEIFYHLTERIRIDPEEIYSDHGKLLPLRDMSKRARMAISELSKEEIQTELGSIKKEKIKLLSKDRAFEYLIKMMGGFDKHNRQLAPVVNIKWPEGKSASAK